MWKKKCEAGEDCIQIAEHENSEKVSAARGYVNFEIEF
jgi:hypothetical protein